MDGWRASHAPGQNPTLLHPTQRFLSTCEGSHLLQMTCLESCPQLQQVFAMPELPRCSGVHQTGSRTAFVTELETPCSVFPSSTYIGTCGFH